MRDVDEEDINKGTVSIYLNDELKKYCDAEFGSFSGEVDVGPGSYNVRVRYHDDSGDYDDSQNEYYDNPIIIKAPEPVTWYVNGSKPYGNDGKSEADAFSTLNEALYAASNNDTVKIAAGTYAGSANIGPYIQKILTFEKYGDGEAIFDGQGQGTIWSVGVDTINIYGLTFINGGGTKGGALYFIRDLSNSVINATFRDNSVTMYGGAIYVDNSVSNLTLRSTFINNTANEDGAAVYIKNAASNLILNSTFIGNTAGNNGAAVYIREAADNVKVYGEFINNNGGDSIIYIGNSVSGNSIHDSVFLNNEAYEIFSVNREITAKDNWFGSNASNYYKIPEDVGIGLENWLFLNATADPSELEADEKSTIIFKLSSFDGSEISDYDASKMNIALDLSQTLGELNKNTTLIGEEVIYTANQEGNASVTGKVGTASYTIKLKNSNKPSPTPTPTPAPQPQPQPTPSPSKVTKTSTEIVSKISKQKTFKTTTKNKKYTITLKDKNNKPIKKAKVTLKVKGKTYKAKTNNKGKATFKLNKLTKKGTYTATIKYKGNKKYKASTKKVKLIIKKGFKTIGPKSKNKKMIIKIQKALKKNGYYQYEGEHYLQIDGKYSKWTQKAVKQYQKDNKLKATGTVDYQTAKKLKITN